MTFTLYRPRRAVPRQSARIGVATRLCATPYPEISVPRTLDLGRQRFIRQWLDRTPLQIRLASGMSLLRQLTSTYVNGVGGGT